MANPGISTPQTQPPGNFRSMDGENAIHLLLKGKKGIRENEGGGARTLLGSDRVCVLLQLSVAGGPSNPWIATRLSYIQY